MARKSSKRGKKSVKPRRKSVRRLRRNPRSARNQTEGETRRPIKVGAAKDLARRRQTRCGKARKPAKAKARKPAVKAKARAPRPATAAPKLLPAKSSTYDAVYARSLSDPEGFWAEAAQGIDWIYKWDKVVDRTNAPFYRWFVGGCQYHTAATGTTEGRERPHHL
jgi:hypothetical protein